jgi:predicted nucleotidyltransferase
MMLLNAHIVVFPTSGDCNISITRHMNSESRRPLEIPSGRSMGSRSSLSCFKCHDWLVTPEEFCTLCNYFHIMQNRAAVRLDFPFPEVRVFRYQAMQDILHHLVNNPFEEFTQQELATITGADISSVSRAVDLLDKLGVLEIDAGKPARISIEQSHIEWSDPVFAIPQHQFRAPIQAFLDTLTSRIDESTEVEELVGVVCFGSVARGTADRSSDIDLLVIVDGDATHGRRMGSETARDLADETFDGDRYEFEVLVETPESAVSHGQDLQEIFDEGIVLERTAALDDVRNEIYAAEQEAE